LKISSLREYFSLELNSYLSFALLHDITHFFVQRGKKYHDVFELKSSEEKTKLRESHGENWIKKV
jgi:hypothetical protein